jgi:alpha-glucosidase
LNDIANNQHYIPIVDSAIYHPNPANATDAYPTYDRGNSSDVFLKNPDGSQYIGSVWPGYTVFPDWHADQSVPWWVNEMSMWHDDINFDGIWIDMSEVSSFCVGSCGSGNITLNPVHPPFLLPGEPGNLNLIILA